MSKETELIQQMSANSWNEGYEDGVKKGYSKAIDDLMNKACETDMSDRDFKFLKEFAEQLKEGRK